MEIPILQHSSATSYFVP